MQTQDGLQDVAAAQGVQQKNAALSYEAPQLIALEVIPETGGTQIPEGSTGIMSVGS